MSKVNLKKIQKVIITLSNGKKLYFSGPQQIIVKDTKNLLITDIKFSEGEELESDCKFEKIEKVKK